MINTNEKLTILHDDNGTFVDFSNVLSSYMRDTASISFDASQDYIYIGFYKPINCLYFDFVTPVSSELILSLDYYNGSGFSSLVGLHDETRTITRSGFVKWNRNQTNETKTTINSTELFWYRLNVATLNQTIVINGVNVVLSDDNDLKRELFEIENYLPSGQNSFIATHEAARDQIVQALNQKAYKINDATTGYIKDITVFDLLETQELKLASTYLVLEKIMMNVSDEVDDLFMVKSQYYRKKYNDIINNFTLSIDVDDDGIKDKDERQVFNYGRIVRL